MTTPPPSAPLPLSWPDIAWDFQGPWTAPGKVISVTDGDTFHALLNPGWHNLHRPPRGVRVLAAGGAAYDAPDNEDRHAKAAATARARLLLPPWTEVMVQSWALDDFGRTLASVLLPDGRDLAAVMTAYGHVKGTPWPGPIPKGL